MARIVQEKMGIKGEQHSSLIMVVRKRSVRRRRRRRLGLDDALVIRRHAQSGKSSYYIHVLSLAYVLHSNQLNRCVCAIPKYASARRMHVLNQVEPGRVVLPSDTYPPLYHWSRLMSTTTTNRPSWSRTPLVCRDDVLTHGTVLQSTRVIALYIQEHSMGRRPRVFHQVMATGTVTVFF